MPKLDKKRVKQFELGLKKALGRTTEDDENELRKQRQAQMKRRINSYKRKK